MRVGYLTAIFKYTIKYLGVIIGRGLNSKPASLAKEYTDVKNSAHGY